MSGLSRQLSRHHTWKALAHELLLVQHPWLGLPCEVAFLLSPANGREAQVRHPAKIRDSGEKGLSPWPLRGPSHSSNDSLLLFCASSHKSSERQEGPTQRPSGEVTGKVTARAGTAGVGWGIKPNPVWPATPSNGQGSAGLSLPSPRGAKSRGFWRLSEVQQGEGTWLSARRWQSQPDKILLADPANVSMRIADPRWKHW